MNSTGRISKILVLSGRYPQSSFQSHLNHAVYCDTHGYIYINCNWPTKASNRYMNKIEYIKKYYDLFDYIFWIDDDAFFMNIEVGLEKFLPKKGNFLSICASPDYKALHTYVSSGQFALKCSKRGKQFIDEILTVDLKMVRKWWNDTLGYFSNGDQDAMVYLLKENPQFITFYERWHYKSFNSRVEELFNEGGIQNIFILHFTGPPKKKNHDYKRVQKYLKYSPALLKKKHEQSYNIIQTQNTYTKLTNLIFKLLNSIKK